MRIHAETNREESIKARHEEEIKQKEADAVAAKKEHRAERSKIEKEDTYINPVLRRLDVSKTTIRSSSSVDDDDTTGGEFNICHRYDFHIKILATKNRTAPFEWAKDSTT